MVNFCRFLSHLRDRKQFGANPILKILKFLSVRFLLRLEERVKVSLKWKEPFLITYIYEENFLIMTKNRLSSVEELDNFWNLAECICYTILVALLWRYLFFFPQDIN